MTPGTRVTLPQLLEASATEAPDHIAVVEPDTGAITYGELDALSNRVRDFLIAEGVTRGDRVGFHMRKSIDAVATLFGILKAGAAYVPVDPHAPAWRGAYILHDCSVKVVIVEASLADALRRELAALGHEPTFLVLQDVGAGEPLRDALPAAPVAVTREVSGGDLAYILYTSGSTGRPKGVMLTHENAMGFVDWCSDTFSPVPADRFSSHAPLHFDLSILDVYVPIKHGATLVLISAERGKNPQALADLIAEHAISIWYSAPSILTMLAQFGRLERHQYPSLRTILFAGEVFPVKHLRALIDALPGRRYYNLYGPTETNVCTYYEVPGRVPDDRTDPYPIGRVCAQLAARVTDDQGGAVPPTQEGELCISGPNVMQGYWNLDEQTASAFLVDPDGTKWYRTGDVVFENADGDYIFVGRRDRMVKRRGYRIELAEIEAGLYRHPDIEEAAVVASSDDAGVTITAFVNIGGPAAPSIIALKKFCAENLPDYMVPDRFVFQEALPKTSTDKIDYQRLKEAV